MTIDRASHTRRTTAPQRTRDRIGVLVGVVALGGGLLLSGPAVSAGAAGTGEPSLDCAVDGPISADEAERRSERCRATDPCIPLGPGSPDAFEQWIAHCRAAG